MTSIIKLDVNEYPIKSVTIFKPNKVEVVRVFNVSLEVSLHVVSEYGNVKAARLLFEHGARVDAQDGDHLTPLHFASRYNNVEVARLLPKHGANVNALDKESLVGQHLFAMGSEDLDIDGTILYGSS
jgi:ankyrin repeat protein